VDFIVEKKGHITRFINEFHSSLARALTAVGHARLAPLVGELSTGEKYHIPCQAADVLCWHTARFNKWLEDGQPQDLTRSDIIDLRRANKLQERKGKLITFRNEVLSEIAGSLLERDEKDI
jgi:hypothetical protein